MSLPELFHKFFSNCQIQKKNEFVLFRFNLFKFIQSYARNHSSKHTSKKPQKRKHSSTVMDLRESLYMNITRRCNELFQSIPKQLTSLKVGVYGPVPPLHPRTCGWDGHPSTRHLPWKGRCHRRQLLPKKSWSSAAPPKCRKCTPQDLEEENESNESDQDLCLRFEFKGPSGRVASSHGLLLFSQKSSTR